MMLSIVCREIRNFFECDKVFGTFEIVDKHIVLQHNNVTLNITPGQYFRVVGSLFNDGVYMYPTDELIKDETFNGAIWPMAVPPDFLALVSDIEEWQNKYGGANSQAMSPFNSESFGGYSYSKGSGAGDGTSGNTWQGAFKARLNAFRKI